MATSFDAPAESRDFAETWRRVMTEPRAFYGELPAVEPLAAAMTFLGLCGGIDAAGTLLTRWSLTAAVCAFLGVVLTTVALAAVATLVAQHLLDGQAGFDPMMRAIAYAAAPLALAWVPFAAGLAWAWLGFLAVRGIAHAQAFDGTRALLTLGASAATLLVVRAGCCG